ncbi:AAA family ATPase [Histidinibacterium aquaticum]|uniref:AAA family ATPase n=2 Tax=Histidinibacterium aquaticum TaxID=2613962 RepID=A0A5J5GC82_9RHOB|nr:AAA family ATPase [Histidinibacterium aquaticum]
MTLDDVTALIGVNESGKTNLLLPLWKLNPAGDGEIDPISDFPKALFGTIRKAPEAFHFITAEFETGAASEELAGLAHVPREAAEVVSVSRSYDGSHLVSFPLHRPRETDDRAEVLAEVEATLARLRSIGSADGDRLREALDVLGDLQAELAGSEPLTANDLIRMRNRVGALLPEEAQEVATDEPAKEAAGEAPQASDTVDPFLAEELDTLRKKLGGRMARLLAPDPGQIDAVRSFVLSRMPVFVYYSNYGNLDSEIYLPHVVENMERSDLGAKEASKARTLRVLFGFVGLEASEILQLGRDFRDIQEQAAADAAAREGKTGALRKWLDRSRTPEPDASILQEIAEAKRTRSILLQSASTKLTENFGEWWKQGDYRFRFEADGNHFRIWVADARRPQEVELENRSTGLQWFLSFFLVFLHESQGAHRNAILLLDEPGHSLHPLAQRDLSLFFEGLAAKNQIIYTTHSPFLVGADRLERARKVFVDRDGSTRVSGDLGRDEGTDTKRGASFAVRAALSVAVADAMLLGSTPVLVRSTTEQIYLSAIKTILIREGRLRPSRDVVFAPSAAPEIIQTMVQLIAGDASAPPATVVDSKSICRGDTNRESAVASACNRSITFEEITGLRGARVEDLFGTDFLAPLVDRIERRPDRLFVDVVKRGVPFTQQVEAWAVAQGISMRPDWRRDLALRAKSRLLEQDCRAIPSKTLGKWESLISHVIAPTMSEAA